MFGLGPATRVYVASGATDMRKGFEGLYGMVRDQLSGDPDLRPQPAQAAFDQISGAELAPHPLDLHRLLAEEE